MIVVIVFTLVEGFVLEISQSRVGKRLLETLFFCFCEFSLGGG